MVSTDELLSVLQRVADAEEAVENRRTELKTAQKRADATSGLTEAAKRDFDNADAKYRVASGETEDASAKPSPPKEEIEAARAVLQQAEQITNAIGASRTALNNAVGAAEQCTTTIVETAGWLQTTAEMLYPTPPEPGHRPKTTEARTAAEGMHTRSSDLETTLGALGTSFQGARHALEKVQDLCESASIQAMLDKYMQAGTYKAETGAKDKVTTLEAVRNKAYRAWQNAPEIERSAQEDLAAKQGALDRAQQALDDAKTARDAAEQDIIERIDVYEEVKDQVKVDLVFFDKDLVFPRDYPRKVKVKWTVKALNWTEYGGVTAYIPTGGRAGNYLIEAHLAIKPDEEEAGADEEEAGADQKEAGADQKEAGADQAEAALEPA